MVHRLRRLWSNLRNGEAADRELDAELKATLKLLIDEKIAAGIERNEARRRALRELGPIEPLKERVRDVRSGIRAETLLHDVSYAARHLRRSPAFAIAAVLTLAVGIGANTAIFTMLNAIMFKPLAISDPGGLLAIAPVNSRGLARSTPMSAIAELRDGPLDPICAYLGALSLPVFANRSPLQTSTTFVTADCLKAFGIAPILGRAITEEEAPVLGPGAHVAMISHRLWTNTFNNDPGVLGQSMLVNNVPVSIVGVLPRGFTGLEIDSGVDIFVPFDAVITAARGRRQLASFILGRLRPGVSQDAATVQIEAQWPQLLQSVLPANMAPTERDQLMDSTPRLIPIGTGTSRLRERYSQPLTMIFALTSVLLLLSCLNLGALLLARLHARSSELAVRLALGGTRWRIAQQMLVENGLLSVIGAIVAMPIAYFAAVTLASFIPPLNTPYALSFVPDTRVFALTAALAIGVTGLMSALPVWFAARRRASFSTAWDRTVVRSTGWWGRGMLAVQVALAITLLVQASLLARSLHLLNTADVGFDTRDLLTVKMWTMPTSSVYGRSDRDNYYPPLIEKVRTLPGVTKVALASVSPRMATTPAGSPVAFKGNPYTSELTGSLDSISPGFFDTMGMRIIAGRDITWQDGAKAVSVGLVSEAMARALVADGDVIGRTVTMRTLPTDLEFVIIGIVSDASQGDPRNVHPRTIYRPILQTGATTQLVPNLIIKTSDYATAASGARQILAGFGRDYALEVISVDDLLARAPATERMSATVASFVGGIAVLLALLGVHGVLAYSVARRTREIGVRIAVGAVPSRAAASVLLEALVVCGTGLALGLPLAVFSARSLRSLMFGVSASDPATYATAALAFVAVTIIAATIPARRAAAVDPVIALRAD